MLGQLNRLKQFALSSADLGTGPVAKCKIFWKQMKNIRVRMGLGSYHPNEIYALETRFGKLYFRDNFGDVTNIVKLLWQGEYRHRALPDEGVILDIGANIGMAAVWFAHYNPDRTIHCFEPLPDNVALVKRNCPSAHVHNLAVGRTRSRASFQVDDYNMMASSVECRWNTHEVQFDVVPLDEFTAEHQIGRIALLKMDAEGMELDILHGAQETLGRISQVVMETHGRDRHQAVIALLQDHGFHIDSETFSGPTGLLFASRRGAGAANSLSRKEWTLQSNSQ